MLDLFGIVFSTVMIAIVLARAIVADRTQPWFLDRSRNDRPAPPPAGNRNTPPRPSGRTRPSGRG